MEAGGGVVGWERVVMGQKCTKVYNAGCNAVSRVYTLLQRVNTLHCEVHLYTLLQCN